MEELVKKYANKLFSAGLAEETGPLSPIVGGLDDTLVWNRTGPEIKVLEQVFQGLNINSLVFLRPRAPYEQIIRYLSQKALDTHGLIEPKDCETRTFLHDLPVIDRFSPDKIVAALKKRKSVIIAVPKDDPEFSGIAIIAHGTVSPEQGFVVASSVCFACFVKFFADYLEDLQLGRASKNSNDLFDSLPPDIFLGQPGLPDLAKGPFSTEEQLYAAIVQAGRKTVEYGLVDSYFGNISYCRNNILYISQTGSSLDELEGCIDPVCLDGSSSAGLTASSELTAHIQTIAQTGCRAILHGHPKFSVILSMACDPAEKAACRHREHCHTRCPQKRAIGRIPIVPGEVGTGPTGLCNTLPPAFGTSNHAIVYGHGVFTLGMNDFSQAFATLLEVESTCRNAYWDKVRRLRNHCS
ncbi:MAG: class II aldolase/adducin family protein [Proteobacteria bacterium]|nr:class II aldolase/adducin family protein [Pseudomonadota bacterium]